MIKYYFCSLKDKELIELSDFKKGVWVHIEKPDTKEIKYIVEKFGLDVDILDDIRDFFEVPRLEKVNGITYFFSRYPYNEKKEDTDTAPLLLIIGDFFVITIVQRDISLLTPLIKGGITVRTTQKTKLFIQIMQLVTNSFEKHLVDLRRFVHRQRLRLNDVGNKEIVRFITYEHKLNDMISSLIPMNLSLEHIVKGGYIQIFDNDKDLVDDLLIDNEQVIASARSLLKTIQNIRGAIESILTNTLNNRIKNLTIITILLTIPTVISSLFGMNVKLPFSDNPQAFIYIIISIIIAIILTISYFNNNKMI